MIREKTKITIEWAGDTDNDRIKQDLVREYTVAGTPARFSMETENPSFGNEIFLLTEKQTNCRAR